MPVYYPVLRWKQGEQAALQNLSVSTKGLISPIVDFPDNCEHTDNRVSNFCRDAIAVWGVNRPFYVDLGTIDYGVTPIGTHPAAQLLMNAHTAGLEIIPVITTDIDFNLLSAISSSYSLGYFQRIALRILRDEEATAHTDAASAIQEIGIEGNNCDLIIDLGDVTTGSIQSNFRILQSLLLQFGMNYRKIICVSGAFDPSEVQTDSNGRIHRNDLLLWIHARQLPELNRLEFGDYTTVQALLEEVQYQGAPKIKYTLDQEWYMIKGHRSRARDNQRQQLSQHIINQQFYRGVAYSFGDNRINQCATGLWGPGSAANWVSNDISQHITFVANQLNAILAGI